MIRSCACRFTEIILAALLVLVTFVSGEAQSEQRIEVTIKDFQFVTKQVPLRLGVPTVANVLARWRRELRHHPQQAFVGNGRSRDEELSQLRREWARVTKERDFLREAAAFFAKAST